MRVAWVIVLLEEVDAWYRSCATKTRKRLHSLQRRSTLLEEDGPNLARPLADESKARSSTT